MMEFIRLSNIGQKKENLGFLFGDISYSGMIQLLRFGQKKEKNESSSWD